MRVSRAASVVVAAGYLIAAVVSAGWDPRTFILGVILLFPLALIWFPEVFGSYLGPAGRGGHIDQESPPFLVAIAGWFFLVGLPLVLFLIARANG
jgi:hypothetical protein